MHQNNMERIIKHTPFLSFLFFGFLITKASLFFPQSLGSSRIEAGWPLTMIVKEYKRVSDININGEIVHSIVPDKTQLFMEKIILNILLWTLILFITWWTYKRVELKNLQSSKQRK